MLCFAWFGFSTGGNVLIDSNFLIVLVLQFLLILCNAFFSATEIAILQLNPTKLRQELSRGDRRAERLLHLVQNPSRFLAGIQIGLTTASLLASAFAAGNFADPMANWLVRSFSLGTHQLPVLRVVSIVFITLLLSFFTLVLGELVPKQIALHRPEAVARATAGPISLFSTIMRPFVAVLSVSTRLVLRLFGIQDERRSATVTEEEIRLMMDAGSENGTIEAEKKQMIENVFDLRDTLARDVMTHRVDVVAIEADADTETVLKIIQSSGMSRFPVYDDNFENILGVLSVRSYLLSLQKEQTASVRGLLRPAQFVPETIKADNLIRDMQQNKDHMAMVMDEYGGFSGLVTLEDLIEEIVGNIYDEFDVPDEPEILQLDENLWRIQGDTDIEDVEKALHIELPEERDYDSLCGLVFNELDVLPDDGARLSLDIGRLHIETDPILDHYIAWARVSVLPLPKPEETEEKSARRLRAREKED